MLARVTTLQRQLGERVAARRRATGLTQAELAERARVSTETVSRLERGRTMPSISLLNKIARSMGADPADLLRSSAGRTKHERAVARLAALLSGHTSAQVDMVVDVAARILRG